VGGRHQSRGCALGTGTNGKTATTRIMAEAARAAGLQVVTNPEGSNLVSGIALARSSQTILSGFPRNGSVLCRSAILENFSRAV
jgi:hypothetical protein